MYLLLHGVIHSHNHTVHKVYLLWCGLFHCPQPLQTPAVLWSYSRPQTLRGTVAWPCSQTWRPQGVPAAAWTSPWPQMLQGVLCSRVDLPVATDASGCTYSRVNSFTGHSPSRLVPDSSSVWSCRLSTTAAQEQQRCSGRGPAQAHGRSCYQNVPSTAKQNDKEQSKW